MKEFLEKVRRFAERVLEQEIWYTRKTSTRGQLTESEEECQQHVPPLKNLPLSIPIAASP
jgi:hypothetical protein